MAELKAPGNEGEVTRERLAELLNEDLAREYQAIIAYVVYSQGAARRIHGHCRAARDPRPAGARSRPDPVAADRLPRQNAGGGCHNRYAPRRSRRRCFDSTWRTRTKRFATTATGSGNARRSGNMPSRNRSDDSRAGAGSSDRSRHRPWCRRARRERWAKKSASSQAPLTRSNRARFPSGRIRA